MDYPDVTPQEANFIEEFNRKIETALQELLGRYKKLNEDYSSEEALSELTSLSEQVSQLTEKISDLCTIDFDIKSLNRDQEKLLELQEELKIIISNIKNLKENVDNLQVLSNEILPDYQQGDILEITGIFYRNKNEKRIWSVTVRSRDSNKGYFRNVDIVLISDNAERTVLGKIKLIQPNTEVKIALEYLGNYSPKVQAFIESNPVSDEYQYQLVLIKGVFISDDDSILVKVLNTSDEKLESNAIYVDQNPISNEFVLNKRQSKTVQIYPQTNITNLICGNTVLKQYISDFFNCSIQFIIDSELNDLQKEQFYKIAKSDSIQDMILARRLVLNIPNPQP
jgi:hypothetical protein